MATDIVMCDNLQHSLNREDIEFLFPSKEECKRICDKLKESVRKVKGALLALEAGEQMDTDGKTLRELVAWLYKVDDLFDLICTSATRRTSASRDSGRTLQRLVNTFTQEVSHFFSPNSKLLFSPIVMACNVKKISLEIEQLAKQLRASYNDFLDRELLLTESLELAEKTVLGRDSDKQMIIDMMLKYPNMTTEANGCVIPIVGLPGLGKSALAQLVYDDEKIKNHFDLRMWIRVSHIQDEKEIIQEIVESCTSRKSNYRDNSRLPAKLLPSRTRTDPNVMAFRDLLGCKSFQRSETIARYDTNTGKSELDIYERRLQKEIDGKLFLLILDDACNKHWLLLKGLLAKGARGSHILVTTRNAEVAKLAKFQIAEVYQLEGLNSKHSLQLFKQLAFRKEDPKDDANLKEKIGNSIVEICKGVPLTIKVAGSFLYGKGIDRWTSFKADLDISKENGADIMDHILQLSYTDLHINLKACFGYCSLFPEDFDFNKNDLISLWIAQGFVKSLEGQSLEEAASMHFLELSRRCFFEDVTKDDLGNFGTCKMHPIIRNLACRNADGVVNIDIADSTCKHVSFNCDRDPSSFLQAQGLRTLFYHRESDCEAKAHSCPYDLLLSHLKCLRVLDLHNLGMKELPSSIGKLIHLRYLDLSKNDHLVTVPQSVTNLYNLQTLKLNSCPKLRILPGNFGQLINLKRFEVDECYSLICMPPGLEKLTQLEMLSQFVVSRDHMTDIGLKALKKLNNLKGRLTIELKGDWRATEEDSKEALRKKKNLEELKITWTQPYSSDVKKSSSVKKEVKRLSNQLELLENLQPHRNLKSLCIEGYKGEYFPTWARVDMLEDSLPNLVVINIEGCNKCQHLPPFGVLHHLKHLTLRHMANVKYVERETSDQESSGDTSQEGSTSSSFFKSLQVLTLHNFYKLEGWRKEVMLTPRHQEMNREFPCLSKLSIWNCPKLTSMPLFPKVEDLDFRNVNQKLLEDCEKKASKITQSENNSDMKHLKIRRCLNLVSFTQVRKGLGRLPVLQHLVVDKCDELTSIVSELEHLTSLQRLEISSCQKLDLSDNSGNSINESRPNERKTLNWVPQISFFQTLINAKHFCLTGMMPNPWNSLKKLHHLTLREIPKMKTLPEGLRHVQNLKFLCISACNALAMLPEWMGSLTKLQHLRIESCPALKSLPDSIKGVTSLMKVEITECPDLMERCREHSGEDWHKIKHARILLHKSWRYGHVSEQGAMQNRSNVSTRAGVKYFIVPANTVIISNIN